LLLPGTFPRLLNAIETATSPRKTISTPCHDFLYKRGPLAEKEGDVDSEISRGLFFHITVSRPALNSPRNIVLLRQLGDNDKGIVRILMRPLANYRDAVSLYLIVVYVSHDSRFWRLFTLFALFVISSWL
jgi:hypothetical protein